MSEPFIAEVRMFANNYAPRGWSYCEGQIIPIAQNTALFSLIGDFYGGDARSTFGLPNLIGRTPMHTGHGPGLSNYTLGETAGTAGVQLVTSQIPSHTHTVTGLAQIGNLSTPDPDAFLAIDVNAGNRIRFLNPENTQSTSLSPSTLANSGLSHAHENRQPYNVVGFCIALMGIYPQRS